MSQQSNSDNILLANRRGLSSRGSIEALITYARDQDEKIFNRARRFSLAKSAAIFTVCAFPFAYFFYSITAGYWRKIYHTSPISSAIEAVQGNVREYYVPEMYLKEREIRKIELGLKDTEELKQLYHKP